jgi:hypothetical protein
MAKQKTHSCKDLILKRFEGNHCPFSHCDYEGNPASERKYFCLLWNRLLQHSNSSDVWRLGYLHTAQIIGNKRCSIDDYRVCPLRLKHENKEPPGRGGK